MKQCISRMKSIWTKVNGHWIHARMGADPLPPDAPVVILVHGMVVASRYMEPTAERLATFCRVYVPDMPGYGTSDKPPELLSISRLADALADWMRALGLTQAAMLGNSFGCQIIAEFAARYPDLIERVVLQGPTIDPSQRTLGQQVNAWLINGYREPGKMTGIMLRDYWAAGVRRAVHTLFMAMEDRIEDKLPHIQVPTLVVRGAEDVIVPQAWAERIIALLPNGRLVVIPGVMHTIVYFNPLELVRVVRPFLLEQRAMAA
jgi:2-hydroxy-6-oxonona-2,4-dienedioate hydrolase